MSGAQFEIPAKFNAGWYLIDRHIEEGRGEKIAQAWEDRSRKFWHSIAGL